MTILSTALFFVALSTAVLGVFLWALTKLNGKPLEITSREERAMYIRSPGHVTVFPDQVVIQEFYFEDGGDLVQGKVMAMKWAIERLEENISNLDLKATWPTTIA